MLETQFLPHKLEKLKFRNILDILKFLTSSYHYEI